MNCFSAVQEERQNSRADMRKVLASSGQFMTTSQMEAESTSNCGDLETQLERIAEAEEASETLFRSIKVNSGKISAKFSFYVELIGSLS